MRDEYHKPFFITTLSDWVSLPDMAEILDVFVGNIDGFSSMATLDSRSYGPENWIRTSNWISPGRLFSVVLIPLPRILGFSVGSNKPNFLSVGQIPIVGWFFSVRSPP